MKSIQYIQKLLTGKIKERESLLDPFYELPDQREFKKQRWTELTASIETLQHILS